MKTNNEESFNENIDSLMLDVGIQIKLGENTYEFYEG